MSDATAFLNEGVTSLTCRLQHVGRWSGVRISKVTPMGRNYNILKVKHSPSGAPTRMVTNALRHRFFSAVTTKRYEVEVTLWIYKLSCRDEGEYICEAEVPFYIPGAIGTVHLIGKD